MFQGEKQEKNVWSMFSTSSSVRQLKPGPIVQCVQESEEQQWLSGDMTYLRQVSNDSEGELQDLGSMLLSHSTSAKKVHSYFSQLESRKCCLHLACRRSKFNSMRVVATSQGYDDGGLKKKSQTGCEVNYLENKELRVFKHAYLCAVFPVLAAPDPPSPLTPSPVSHNSNSIKPAPLKPERLPGTFEKNINNIDPSPASSSMTSPIGSSPPIQPRPFTPYSLHDSGVEESEEAALIPMESICEQLQRAFRLSRTMFRHYESLIVKTYAKKSSQRLLAEGLSGQLAVLESNHHPFYSPNNFITQNGYDLWQKQERTHIAELLNKFWQSSLPFPRDNQDLIAELHSVHEDYHILLKKLLLYENQFRQESNQVTSAATYTPLSSASCRLLLEFGLRYGIGEVYRKILLLECLVSEFSPTIGYMTFVTNLVVAIHQLLPSNKSALVLVKTEFEILSSTLKVLQVQASKSLRQIKSLFPGNRPVEGLDQLLTLLKSVLALMSYLSPANTKSQTFDTYLKTTIQAIFQTSYEMFKTVALDDLHQGREVGLDPRLLSALIQDVREDVADYKMNFEKTFQRYFSISSMAANAFYHHLMEDVVRLSHSNNSDLLQPKQEIDLRMLAVAYRLNQLDLEWKMYITPLLQTWRVSFQPILSGWISALGSHVQNLVLEAVAGDAYNSEFLDLPQPLLSYQSVTANSDRHSCSVSGTSFSPSVNSAFSSIVSSIRSTPYQSSGHETVCLPSRTRHESIPESLLEHHKSESLTVPELRGQPDTRSLNLEEPSTATSKFQASRKFSLPEKLNEMCVADRFKVNQFYTDKKDLLTKVPWNSCGKLETLRSADETDSVSQGLLEGQDLNSSLRVLTPLLSDSETDGQDNQSDLEESLNEDFRFPPLKIVSQKKMNPDSPSNFSKPVFSKPKSEDSIPARMNDTSNQRHLLCADVPHSMSSRASSVVHQWEENLSHQDFNDSMDSNVSFPEPADALQAILPISGSSVDVLVILQRLCGFATSVVTLMLGNEPSQVDLKPGMTEMHRQVSSESVPGREGQVLGQNSGYSSTSGELKENVPVYKTLSSSSVSHLSTSSSSARQFSSVTGNCLDQSDHNWSPNNGSTPSDPVGPVDLDLSLFDKQKLRLALHLRFLKVICNVLLVYSTNMLCMDLCSTPKAVAKRLLGSKLVDYVEVQVTQMLVWGCRHQAEVSHDCLYYNNHKTTFLCDRYEPVTRHMCTRINNVYVCLNYLEVYEKKLMQVMNVEGKLDTVESSTSKDTRERGEEDLVSEEDQLSESLPTHCDHVQDRWSYQSQQAVDMTHQQLMSTLTGMCRLLTYKLNLFIRDALPLLIERKPQDVSIETCLQPVTSFLQKYLDALSSWLYQDCFNRVLNNMWVMIVQDFEFHADKLKTSGASASHLAHSWMLAMSHLIKFMNNNGQGIKKDLLLAQANDVIFQLQLYTLSTWHLVALHQNLREFYTEVDFMTLEDNAKRSPPAIIYRIHKELQALRKSFSGAELVHWIVKNKDVLPADLSIPSEIISKESATSICQTLMDEHFIVEMESQSYTGNPSPISICPGDSGFSPYPEISVHSHANSDYSQPWGHRQESQGGSGHSKTIMAHASIHNSFNDRKPHSQTSSPTLETISKGQTDDGLIEEHVDEGDEEVQHLTRGGSDIGFSHKPRTRSVTPTKTRHSLDSDDGLEILDSHRCRGFNSGLPQSATVSDFRSSQVNGVQKMPRNLSADNSRDNEFFPDHDKRLTPFSSLGQMNYSNRRKFIPSSRIFYLVQPNSLTLQSGCGLGDTGDNPNSLKSSRTSSSLDAAFVRLRGSQESLALVEECFIHKQTPVNIAAIIAGRKKADGLARNFVRQLSADVQERIHNVLDEPVLACRSS